MGVTVIELLQVLVGDGDCRLGKCAEFIHYLKQEKECYKIAHLQGAQHAQIQSSNRVIVLAQKRDQPGSVHILLSSQYARQCSHHGCVHNRFIAIFKFSCLDIIFLEPALIVVEQVEK